MAKKTVKKTPKQRSAAALGLAVRTGNHAGHHHNRSQDVARGSSRKAKHKGNRDG